MILTPEIFLGSVLDSEGKELERIVWVNTETGKYQETDSSVVKEVPAPLSYRGWLQGKYVEEGPHAHSPGKPLVDERPPASVCGMSLFACQDGLVTIPPVAPGATSVTTACPHCHPDQQRDKEEAWSSLSAAQKLWREEFGDPGDAETQRKIDQTVEIIRANARAAARLAYVDHLKTLSQSDRERDLLQLAAELSK